jgi:hypothetical protein
MRNFLDADVRVGISQKKDTYFLIFKEAKEELITPTDH